MSMRKGTQLSGPNMRPRFERTLPRRKKAPTTRTLNKKIRKMENRFEINHKDVDIGGTNMAAAGVLISGMNFIAPGDLVTERDGQYINATSLVVNLRISNNATLISTGATYRIIIFWCTQTNGAAPTIFGDTGLLDNSVMTTLDLVAPRNTATRQKFKILYDKTFAHNSPDAYEVTVPNAVAGTPYTNVTLTTYRRFVAFRKKIKLSRQMQFVAGAGAGTIADLLSNSIHIALIDEGGTMAFTGGVRLYFKD